MQNFHCFADALLFIDLRPSNEMLLKNRFEVKRQLRSFKDS